MVHFIEISSFMTDLYHVFDNRKFLIHVSYPLLDFSVIVYLMNVIVQVVVEESDRELIYVS